MFWFWTKCHYYFPDQNLRSFFQLIFLLVQLCTRCASMRTKYSISISIIRRHALSGSSIFTSLHQHGHYYKTQHCLIHPMSLCQMLQDDKATLQHIRHELSLTHRSLMQCYDKMTSSTATSPRPPANNVNWLSASTACLWSYETHCKKLYPYWLYYLFIS